MSLALFFCMAIVALLSFVLFPPRRLAVTADGESVVLVSREQDSSTLLNLAGVQPIPGDAVVHTNGEIRVERAVPARIEVDGQTVLWRTRSNTPLSVLDEVGVDMGEKDAVLFNGIEVQLESSLPVEAPQAVPAPILTAPTQERIVLTIRRAVPVTINEDGRLIVINTSRPTLDEVFKEAGVKLGPADEISLPVTTPITSGLQVNVKHAKAINLRIGTSSRLFYTIKATTVKEALAEQGLFMGPDDRTEPSLEASVFDGMSARLVRVTGRSILEKDEVMRKTVFKVDEKLTGYNYRRVEGRDGMRVREYRLLIEDGVEKEKKFVKEYMEPEVVDNVIYYASAAARGLNASPANLKVNRTERMWATWYNAASSGKAANDPAYSITYSGVPVVRGIVAVDPAVIPLGTRLFIPGYGFAIAGDTGGGIIGKMIDLGFADGETVDWITGWADVYILE